MKKQSASLHRQKTSAARFDPFNNRLSRNIRNTLAEIFVDALLQSDKSGYQRAAEQWLAQNLDHESTGYIQDRLKRYDRAFNQIKVNRIKDAKLQALIIWNHGLFFEVHEHLERIWHTTDGDEYQALKGLIQAAGVYIHLKFNHRAAAERLAIKSSDRIQKYSDCLPYISNLKLLLDKLKNLDPAPPQLNNPGLQSN
ncbi:hypothetical protein D1BOALGB6SA_706 [Olavius sp. associated proteobacterium Delta 1]|nr:hypothetical protein D1BOALGB6SA_706 [Olavius sp. associated proteobacterium Delta 1]